MTKLFFCVLFLAILLDDAFCQCLENPDFAIAGNMNKISSDDCETWANIEGQTPIVPNWNRSHGSPNIGYAGNPIDNYVFMWAVKKKVCDICTVSERGEGIYASYPFKKGISYTLNIRVNITDPSNSGGFKILCANGLIEPDHVSCGDPIPSLPQSQWFLIANNTSRNQGWQVFPYTFIPSQDFSQLWIYPYTSSSTQLNMLLDYVTMCPTLCSGPAGTQTFFSSGQIPTGVTQKDNIYVGTWYGSNTGTVTISGTAQTTLLAGSEIVFKPNFTAQVSTGSFLAQIVNCTTSDYISASQTTFEPQSFDSLSFAPDSTTQPRTIRTSEVNTVQLDKAKIYPNQTTGKLTVEIQTNVDEKTNATIINSMGIVVKNYRIISNRTDLIIGNLPSGTYFIQLSNSKGKILTQKFVKTK